MATTIDHLREDHRVTVLREFTDAKGITMRVGDSGVLRKIGWDSRRMEIHLEIERPERHVSLMFPLHAKTGPRIGHMREYLEIGEDVSTPRIIPAFRDPSLRKMIVPSSRTTAVSPNIPDGPDRLEAVEAEMRKAIPHIGAAASIAEMYAQRMRTFQRAGNEPRAIAAFKLAVDWMGTYASWATSGGEGMALSAERDQFRTALVLEFGYDPTDTP